MTPIPIQKLLYDSSAKDKKKCFFLSYSEVMQFFYHIKGISYSSRENYTSGCTIDAKFKKLGCKMENVFFFLIFSKGRLLLLIVIKQNKVP